MSVVTPANYFDHAATCPTEPLVVERMLPWLTQGYGNPNSLHQAGREAMAAVEQAAQQIANLIGCAKEEIVFTSGATEANNAVANWAKKLTISPFEHSAMREPAMQRGSEILQTTGWELQPPVTEFDKEGWLSVMSISNETGVVIELPHSPGWKVHRDMTQQLGKLPLDVSDLDAASFSAHKLYGPKGIGALYIEGGVMEQPFIVGGSQQMGRRAGTLPTALIVGFGAACEIASDRIEPDLSHVAELRNIVKEELSQVSETIFIESDQQSPYILSVAIHGLQGETMAVELDNRGFAISSGPACSAGDSLISPALLAAGFDEKTIRSVIRISFGRANTKESAKALGSTIKSVAEGIR